MSKDWTKAQCSALGDFLLAHLKDAKETVRQHEASDNRGTEVSREDANMLDSYADQTVRQKAVKLAVCNIKRELHL